MTDPASAGIPPEEAAARAAENLKAVAEGTGHLLRTVADLDPDALGGPSALPGWTRGHVLAHLSRNADSLVNLLETARTGVDVPQYASPEAREQGIRDGAGRPLDEQLADLRRSSERLAAAAGSLPGTAWTVPLRHRTGYVFPAYDVPWKRLMEVEYHHVDLDAGYTPAHWPESFASAELARLAARLDGAEGLPGVALTAEDTGARARIGEPAGPELAVEGPVRALTAWLSGRSDGDGLQVHRAGVLLPDPRTVLPQLPPLN
ncbi:maleylpyruvate isomerase family mycothiol-dependent enzyme [Kitasatospora sp. NPDC085895]|uniref:maleylpyruvate isomerase family mycothiol-dependent enzyme n=1 Tax=Kitasatospora sp. NPDC085895 TaxID=3155057 RepID=UPI00344D7A79